LIDLSGIMTLKHGEKRSMLSLN